MATNRFIVLTVALIFLSLTAVGCNTVKGLGKDLQAGAENVENAISHDEEHSDW